VEEVPVTTELPDEQSEEEVEEEEASPDDALTT
jgi:hypothetical protein